MTVPTHPRTDVLPEHDLVQLLAPDGTRREHPDYRSDVDVASLCGLYRDLFLVRRVDTEAHALQRHGELGLWAPCLGQEAAQVGAGRALQGQDFVFPTYREHGLAWCRGIDPVKLLGLFRGTELGGWDPTETGMALYSIVIGAQTLHAVGYAMGLGLDDQVGHADAERDSAVLACFGDGATSQGDVNEAFVWAASFHAPVVFLCQNNQYAISVPLERQTHVPLAQRAAGYGFPGVRVDGNDVLAVQAVVAAALERARNGEGPTLVEAVTYRLGPHTTSDDPTRYRDAQEVEHWKERDPLLRVRRHLEAQGVEDSFFADLDAEAEALGRHLREACKALPEPDLAEVFDLVHAEGTPELAEQKAAYVAYRASFEGGAA